MIRPIVITSALSLSACIAYPCHETPRIKVSLQGGAIDLASEEKVKPGDTVHAVRPDGVVDDYEVVTAEETGFTGTAWDHKQHQVLYRNVRALFVDRPHWTVCVLH